MPGQLGLLPDQPFQPNLPSSSSGGGLLEDLVNNLKAGDPRNPYQPQQTLGTYQEPLAPAASGSQDLLSQISDYLDQQAATSKQAAADRLARYQELMAPLYGDRHSTLNIGDQAVVPGFEKPMLGENVGSVGAPISPIPHPSYPVEGGTQPSLPQTSGQNLEDLLSSLYQNNPSPAQALPNGVTQDMVAAAHHASTRSATS